MKEAPSVPSYLRAPPLAVCWNCERDAGDTVAVTLETPSGGQSTIRLCDRCYDADYAPLVARSEGLGVALTLAP